MPDFVEIENGHKLIRDTRSMAILNVDAEARERYRKQREKILREKAQMEELKKEVSELKSLVTQLLEKLNG